MLDLRSSPFPHPVTPLVMFQLVAILPKVRHPPGVLHHRCGLTNTKESSLDSAFAGSHMTEFTDNENPYIFLTSASVYLHVLSLQFSEISLI